MVPYYQVAEQLVNSGQLANIGIADLCVSEIKRLNRLVSLQPNIVQVNYAPRYEKNVTQGDNQIDWINVLWFSYFAPYAV